MDYEQLKEAILTAQRECAAAMEDKILYIFSQLQQDLPRVVRAGENLQAVLDDPNVKTIQLEGGSAFVQSGGFIIRRPLRLLATGAALHGQNGPGIRVEANDVQMVGGSVTAENFNAVFCLGWNESHQTLETEPKRIILEDVVIPTHRRVRGFEINAREVVMTRCKALDIFDTSPSLSDSQGIALLNTSGAFTAIQCHFQAGSEDVLVGGDNLKMVGAERRGIMFDTCLMDNPPEWQGTPENEKTKNGFELKDGRDVTVKNCTIQNIWTGAGQQAYAVVLTPRMDSPGIRNVSIENVKVRNCGGFMLLIGRQDTLGHPHTPHATQIFVRGGTAVVNRAQYGGLGNMLLASGAPDVVSFEDFAFMGDGAKAIDVQFGGIIQPDGTKIANADPIRVFSIRRSKVWLGGVYGTEPTSTVYGITFGGNHWGNNAANLVVNNLDGKPDIHENVFSSTSSTAISRTQSNLPADNEFVTADEFAAMTQNIFV